MIEQQDLILYIFELLVVFQLKHYIADFPLQREYMLRKTRANWDFVVPLGLHSSVHAFGTLVICLYYAPHLWWLALVDLVVHFVIDRLKSGPLYFGRFNDLTKSSFWNIMGLDQMLHHITHLYIVYLIVTQTV